MKWIKASERLPEDKDKVYVFRVIGVYTKSISMYLNFPTPIPDLLGWGWDKIEWLDESEPPAKKNEFENTKHGKEALEEFKRKRVLVYESEWLENKSNSDTYLLLENLLTRHRSIEIAEYRNEEGEVIDYGVITDTKEFLAPTLKEAISKANNQ